MAKQTKAGAGRRKGAGQTKGRVPDAGGESEKSSFGVSDEEVHNMSDLQLEKFALALGIDDALSMERAELIREVEAKNR